MIVMAPISVGELIDKITILSIKAERLIDPKKQLNVSNELIKLVKNVDNLKLLFMSATPMFNDYKEIIFLTQQGEEELYLILILINLMEVHYY